MNPSIPCSSNSTTCGSASKYCLKTVATGLFVDWNKRKVLIEGVKKQLKERFNTFVECGPQQPSNICQLMLRAFDPPSLSLSHSNGSHSSANFVGSKDLLDRYLSIIKECRPNFKFEKQPETIDLDASDDETFCIIADDSESTNSKPDLSIINLETQSIKDEEHVNNIKEPVRVRKSNTANVVFVDLIDENEKEHFLSSDIECKAVNSPPKDLKKPDGALLKNNEPFENEKQAQVVLDISDDVIIVESCDEEHHQNNKGSLNINNLNITAFGGKRMVCLTPESDKIEENNKPTSELDSGLCKNKRMRLMSDSSSISNNNDRLEASPTNKRSQQRRNRRKLSKVRNKTNTAEHLVIAGPCFDIEANKLNQGNSKENESAMAIPSSPKAPKKNLRLLSYKRLPHLIQSTTKTSSSSASSNIFNPVGPVLKRSGLRPIVIDASNVGVRHGKGVFSVRGIQLCINFFEKRGHRQIKAFIPHYRKNRENHDALVAMENQGTVVVTPSRRVDNKVIASYDDRYIVQYAHEVGGVIVSTDNFRDLIQENPEWRDTIEKRLLMFTWIDDILMFPQDPLGRNGPSLDEYLKFPD